jgi:hypothetical protein
VWVGRNKLYQCVKICEHLEQLNEPPVERRLPFVREQA